MDVENFEINDIIYNILQNKMFVIKKCKIFKNTYEEILPRDSKYPYYIERYLNFTNILKNIEHVSNIDFLSENKNIKLSKEQLDTLKLIKEII